MNWPFGKTVQKLKNRVGRVISFRGFQAAQTDRLLANWKWDGGFTPAEIASSLAVIRSRSRDMAKNSPHYKRFLQMIETNVVGEGFHFKSVPHDGFPGEPQYRVDEQASRFIEWHFWRWSTARDKDTRATMCDSTGRKTLAQMDRQNSKVWARDGEHFTLIMRTNSNPYGITLRSLRPDLCDHTYNVERLSNGNLVHCGVEMNPETRMPVAYYFHTPDRNAYSVSNGRGQPLIRIPASRIIHGFTQEDEDQPRGVPWAHAILVKLKMLEEYDKSEITAARDEACSVRTYYAPNGNLDEIADLTSGDNEEVANALVADKQPGQSEVLPIGWKQEIHTPQHPNRELTAFKASMLRDVASGLGVEYANYANDWAGVSFSSVRLGTIGERDMWQVLQNDYMSQKSSPVFLAWLNSFLSLQVSGGLPIAKFNKFAEHEFRGRRWMWVDPMKDMKAAEIAVQNAWKTNTQIAADLGTDYNDNVEELLREQQSSKNRHPQQADTNEED